MDKMVIGQTLKYVSYIKDAIIIYSNYCRQEVYNMLVYSSRYRSHSNHDSMWGIANCVLVTINQVNRQQHHYLVDSSIQCG